MYPAVAHGSVTNRRKLRLCLAHFTAFQEQLALHAADAQSPMTDEQLSRCYLCGHDVEGYSAAFYLTAYGKDSQRTDWWAPLHEDCAEATMDDWLIGPDMA